MSTQIATPAVTPDGVRILIVEASEPTRLGLAFLLQRQDWVQQCYLSADQDEAVAMTSRHHPHVALVEVATIAPFQSVVGDALRRAYPYVQLVFTSRCATTSNRAVEQACGAGFVPPEASGSTVIDVVRAAAEGRPTVLEQPAPAVALTQREREVLAHLATGATNREIAAAMYLGPDTVKKNATAIYRKLGVRNRTEATKRAFALADR
jgi:DNA-binding NarL/FixJ family response regulator